MTLPQGFLILETHPLSSGWSLEDMDILLDVKTLCLPKISFIYLIYNK